MPGLAELDGVQGSQCMILYFAEGWRVMLDGRKRGRYDYQVDAVDAALRLSVERAQAGSPVEVWVQDRFGELQLVTAESAAVAA